MQWFCPNHMAETESDLSTGYFKNFFIQLLAGICLRFRSSSSFSEHAGVLLDWQIVQQNK